MLKSDWRLLVFRLLLIIFLITGVKIAMREPTNQQSPITTTTTIQEQWNEDNLNTLIEKIAKEESFESVYLLKELAKYESRYMIYDKILDVNGYYSYGLLHMQLYTFLEQAKLYKVIDEDVDLEEGRILIMNPELQLRTICRMDLETIRKKWYNSWNKIYCR